MQKKTVIILLIIAVLASGLTGFQVGRWTEGAVYAAEKDGWRLKAEKAEQEQQQAEEAAAADEESAETMGEDRTVAEQAPAEEQQEEASGEASGETSETTFSTAPIEEDEEIKALLEEARHMAEEPAVEEEHEEVVKDPAYLENPGLAYEPDLPEGVVSTLYDGEPEMQIVILGDSQIGNFKGEDGIAFQVAQKCRANVYNLAMGGTAACLLPTDLESIELWDSRCLVGMVNVLTGRVSPDLFRNYTYTYDIYESCDFTQTDVFVLEYGVNDYFQKSPLGDSDNFENLKTYIGAVNYSIRTLHRHFPQAKIILCTPTYALFYDGQTHEVVGSSDYVSNGVAALCVYARGGALVAYQLQNIGIPVRCFNAYDESGIRAANAETFLLDGIHMNQYGRIVYADVLSRYIIRPMGYEVANDEDLLASGWWDNGRQ